MENKNKIFPPRYLNLSNHIYAYKDALINDVYSYRCKYRSVFNAIIHINKTNLIKYNDNPDNENIEYSFAKAKETHKCEINSEENKNENKIIKNNEKPKLNKNIKE